MRLGLSGIRAAGFSLAPSSSCITFCNQLTAYVVACTDVRDVIVSRKLCLKARVKIFFLPLVPLSDGLRHAIGTN